MQKTFHRVVIIANNLALEELNTTQQQLKRRQLSYEKVNRWWSDFISI